MKLGYIRVSNKDQNTDRQLEKMKELEIEKRFIFIDKVSGKDFKRPAYEAMKTIMRKGDLIYIDSLDRLGRSYDGIIKEWKEITRTLEGDIVILENKELFDSRKFKAMGDIGKLMEDQFLSLLGYVAEQERKKIRIRQAEGIAIAKKNGIKIGRRKIELDSNQKIILEQNYNNWINKKITGVKFANMLNLKKNTFYRILKEYEKTISK